MITELDDRLYMIDAMMFDDVERLACYLYDGPERVLIECGPSRSLHNLVAALDQLGVDDVATIVVTHIHLDHAGGAGHLAERYPGARIGVHGRGAPHMARPERLIRSATRIYGEDGMAAMWGPMRAIPEERLLVLDEGDRIPLGGGRHLDVMYTPGHAQHHLVFFDPETGGMYVGDAVGLAFPHGHFVQPATPPPDLDPPLLIEQLHRMARREPEFLGFAHYGPDHEPQARLADAERRLEEWVRFVEQLPPDASWEQLREWALAGYEREGFSPDVIATYDKNTYWPMQLTGIQRWLRLRDQT